MERIDRIYLDASATLSTAWEYAKKHGLIIAAVLFVLSLVTQGASSLFNSGANLDHDQIQHVAEQISKGDMEALKQVGEMYRGVGNSLCTGFSALLNMIVYVGLYNLALGLFSGRFTETTFDAFNLPVTVYLKYIAVSIICGILGFVSALFCLIPWFFVAPRLVLAPVYQIDHPEEGVIESIKASWKMTEGNTGSMIMLGVFCFLISIVGFLACCVGAYFAEAIELFALVAAYNQLKANCFVQE
ncbi:MAG: hypothetical protein MJZ41_02700 [Bacteroidaceae bacterium]|nr:hypothetical protein [Bacteroidaceae bacterium]